MNMDLFDGPPLPWYHDVVLPRFSFPRLGPRRFSYRSCISILNLSSRQAQIAKGV